MASIKNSGKVNINVGVSIGSIALLLMVAGWAMESANYEPELGAVLFTIGFWIFVIPIIIIGVTVGIFLLIALAKV